MKAFVTGGAGYIGSHTCKLLAQKGHDVMVYDNLSTGHRKFARWGEFIHGDILETQKLRAAFREWHPDVVIHFAAKAYVGESVLNPGKYFRNNAAGTLSILEAMRDEEIPNIVVSGTCAVYGQPEAMPIVESMPARPINPYGASKLFMERMLNDFSAAHGINWTSLRYFNAAGSDPDGEVGELHDPETHLIPRVMMAAAGIIPEIEIFGNDYPTQDGTCVRDYIHVNDLAEAHILAASHLMSGGDSCAFNLGTGQGVSVKEIIDNLEKIRSLKIPYSMKPRRAGDPACLVADASKAATILNWRPRQKLDNILSHAWEFFSANKDFFKAAKK